MHEVLRQIPYSIFAIGVGATPGDQNAFIASWVTQCSFEPALIAVAIRKGAISKEQVDKDRVFTVNLLGKNQTDLARQLVKPQHRVGNKLDQISYFEEMTGAPILKDATAFIECRVVSTTDTGDHNLFVGEVVNAGQSIDKDLLSCSDIGWIYAG